MTKTNEQLITENEELRSRLVETEEAIIAIQSGEVDAIVVSGRKGEQVYSISSAETPYRAFIEEMDEGALTLSKKGLVIYCNRRFAELAGEPIEKVIGSYFKHFIVPDDRDKFDKLLAGGNKNNVLIISLINSLYLKLSIHLMPAYLQGDNYILVATDVSEMKKEEKKLLELSRLLEQKLALIHQLRMQLIEKKIEAEVEIKKLNSNNSKLVREIARHKLTVTELKQKLKQKRGTG
ncbi:PAS domain S-box protein [bacterium]|jgi:PAS domain S-box-containing protein|nr:PAS domain S-box protein [bacterium]